MRHNEYVNKIFTDIKTLLKGELNKANSLQLEHHDDGNVSLNSDIDMEKTEIIVDIEETLDSIIDLFYTK